MIAWMILVLGGPCGSGVQGKYLLDFNVVVRPSFDISDLVLVGVELLSL